MNTALTYQYYDIFEIPNMPIGIASSAISIPTMSGVFNASDPKNLEFTQQNLPKGLDIQKTNFYVDNILQREAGTIYGYPQNIEPQSPGFAILTVTDTKTK